MLAALLIFGLLAQDDAAAEAALEKYRADYKSKDLAVRVTAVQELGKTQHDKVYAKLGQLLVVDDIDVRIAAAKGLEGCTGNRKKAAFYLASALGPNAKDPRVTAPILVALGKLREEAAVPEVEKHLKIRNLDVAKAAIEACGEIRAKSSVPALIELLRTLDKEAVDMPDVPIGGGKGGGGKGVKGAPKGPGAGLNAQGEIEASGKERKEALAPLCHRALTSLTDMRISSTKDWEDWWREKSATFKVPPRN